MVTTNGATPTRQIHIVPEAVMELSEVVSYPIGGITVLGGILVMIILESSLTALWSPKVRWLYGVVSFIVCRQSIHPKPAATPERFAELA